MNLDQAIKNVMQAQHYEREQWAENKRLGLDFSAGINAGRVNAFWEMIHVLKIIQAEQQPTEEEIAYKL